MRAFTVSRLFVDRVGDGDVMAGKREHLRDAVAHQAGADDRDFRLGHRSALARTLTLLTRLPRIGSFGS